MAILLPVIVILAGLILLQDFLSRSVLWFLFPLLAAAGIILGYLEVGLQQLLLGSAVNLLLLFVQMLLLALFLLPRGGWKKTALAEKIGLGDVLFLVACCFFFSPVNFMAFHIVSLLLALVLHFIFLSNRRYSKSGSTVALAGWQALALLLVLLLAPATSVLYSDNWLLNSLLWKY